jgi:hypothetical protein
MEIPMRLVAACLALLLFAPAMAQNLKPDAKALSKDAVYERAKQRCEENHGADCSSSEGLKEWMDEERPMTAEQQHSAAVARLRRENCAKKGGAGC